MRVRAVAFLIVLSMSACGASSDGSSTSVVPGGGSTGNTGSDAPVTMTPGPGGDVGTGRPQRVKPRPGMADVRAVGWENARQTPDGRKLRITYWSGVEPCNVLDRVDVSYDPQQIVVTLYEGYDPDAEDVACIEIAVKKVVVVDLEEPVAGRKIVDGAR